MKKALIATMAALLFATTAHAELKSTNVWSDVDSITTATADTITVDWSDTAKIPSWAKSVYIAEIGIGGVNTLSSFTHAVDILIGSSTQAGSYTWFYGTAVGVPMTKIYTYPLAFKRSAGNVQIIMSRAVPTTCDFWVRGWFE